jgi:hypothetical protein
MPVNQYVEFVRQWAKDNGLTYMCSIGNPNLKADYLKFKSGNSYGEEMDFQPKPKKKKVEQEFEITPAKKKKVEKEIEITPAKKKKVEKEIEITPASKKKVESNKLTEIQIKNLDSINERISIINNKMLDLITNDRLDIPLSEADWNQNKSKLINQVEDFMLNLNKLKNGTTKVMVNKLEPILYALEDKLNSIKNIKYKKKLSQEEIKLREEISEKNTRDNFIKEINELSEYEDKDDFDEVKNDILNNGSMESYAKRSSENPIIQQYYNDIKLKFELLKKVTFKTRNSLNKKIKQKATPVPKVKVTPRPIRKHEESQIVSKSAWLTESFDRYLNNLKTENYPVKEFNSRKQDNIDFLKELIDELTNQRKEYINGGGYIVSMVMNKYRDFLEKFKSLKFDKNSLINYLKEMAKIENLSDKQLTVTFDRLKNLKSKNEDESIQNLIEKAVENIQQIYDARNKKIQLSAQEEKCLELFKKLNIVTRSDLNKQFVKYKKEAIEKGIREFEKYPPYVELSNCRGVFEDQLLKNPPQAKPSAPETPVMSPVAKPLLLKYLSRKELYKLIEAKATPK